MSIEATEKKSSVLHTLGAIPIALVIWILVSTLASLVWYLMNNFMTVIRPEIIGFIANIIGAVFGISVAQAAVESWTPRYAGKPVAVAIILMCVLALFTEWLVLPNPAHPVQVSAAAVTSIFMAYQAFWVGADML